VFWHSKLMTECFLGPDEVIDYCDQHSSILRSSPSQFNPYKIGIELFKKIYGRWEKGEYGASFVYEKDLKEKQKLLNKNGRGLEKIFEVRKYCNDITFIDEFFDEEFCYEQQFFLWNEDRSTGRKVISTKDFKRIKNSLLDKLTNFGQPAIELVDGNYMNRSEILLEHTHFGQDIRVDWAFETLKNMFFIWKRPIHLISKLNQEMKILSYDGISTDLKLWKGHHG